MDSIQITFHPVALYQLAAFPCAVLYCYLCSYGQLPTILRYLYLLFGGVILACMSMGYYAILLFTPTLGATVLFHTVSYHSVHRWAFLLQMTWQTICHLWMMYRQYYFQEIITIKVYITISSLMLLTQKISSLAMDIHERKVTVSTKDVTESKKKKKGPFLLPSCSVLAVLSYLLFFPALLGGPLLTFVEFQHQINDCKMHDNLWSIWTAVKACMLFFVLHTVRGILFDHGTFSYNLMNCRQWECAYVMWSTALSFKLIYYSHWLLDEALLYSAGFSMGVSSYTDSNIYILETTNRISMFARTWNKTVEMRNLTMLMTLLFSYNSLFPLLYCVLLIFMRRIKP
ncbi:hypothetical protein GDO81_000896 [Engystomops pustulosus]|uniref:Uncharacterized protein n=1 Tax=Engystomops pustulosus TaxID=76066 RepID=A0AAV7D8W6_ENGPU|nr:hypothetical protein GDO81_000896 [Engystomops pustulosus]